LETPGTSRDQTRERILDAAKRVLAETGYARFGVNAVAREAGCDKVLIYRYFGGVEGLAEAMGDSLTFWLPEGAPVTPGAPMRPPCAQSWQAIWTPCGSRHL